MLRSELSGRNIAGKLPVTAAMVAVEQQSSAGAMPAQRPLPAGGLSAADMPSMAPTAPIRPPVRPSLFSSIPSHPKKAEALRTNSAFYAWKYSNIEPNSVG